MISYSQRAIRRDADWHEKRHVPLDALDDRDQSGLDTAVHEAERTEPSSTTNIAQIEWPKRLEELARRTVTSPSTCRLDGEVAQSIHHHLDALERILGDSISEPAKEISQDQTEPRADESVESDKLSAEASVQTDIQPPAPNQHDSINKEEMLCQLQVVMNEVTALNEEVEKRRKESSEIRELFEERCRGLTRTVAELEDEVVELQGDLVEDSIELEGIQGTVRGLEDWIDGLRETQRLHRLARDRTPQEARRRWAIRGTQKSHQDLGLETDGEIFLDGLTAWMRGWRDVDEEFKIRSRARRTRREKRQEQFSRPKETKMEGTSRRY